MRAAEPSLHFGLNEDGRCNQSLDRLDRLERREPSAGCGRVHQADGAGIGDANIRAFTAEFWKMARAGDLADLEARTVRSWNQIDLDEGGESARTSVDGRFCAFMKPSERVIIEVTRDGYQNLVELIDGPGSRDLEIILVKD